MIATGYHPDWDVRWKEGNKSEVLVDMFGRDGVSVEVKSEVRHWYNTGNMAFEYYCRNNPSGLSITKSEFWAVAFQHDGAHAGVFIFETVRLKRNLVKLWKAGILVTRMYGDRENGYPDGVSKGLLCPLYLVKELLK